MCASLVSRAAQTIVNSGPGTKYRFHVEGVEQLVKAYKTELPKGMEPSDAYVDMLRGKVSTATVKVRDVIVD